MQNNQKNNLSQKFIYVFLKLTSHGILHYLCSADLSKSFFLLIVSIFIFSQYFFQQILPGGKIFYQLLVLILSYPDTFFSTDFARWKSVGLLHIAYIVVQ